MTSKYDYDAIIIGAGVGGLVCGCYLAKAGMKVLIVEKNKKVGGYCTSFKREGFSFDAAAHALGSCRQDGRIGIILRDLKLDKRIEITRSEISDIIITPDYKISFKSNINETINDLQETFPNHFKEIKAFFEFIKDTSFSTLLLKLRNKSFADLLSEYFKDPRLNAILGVVLGNIGLPPSKASAFSSVNLYREHILDGGYYPKGGMQSFSNALAEYFKDSGGELFLDRLVIKIKIKDGIIKGILLEDNSFISSKYIVSNCDAMQTFIKLIGTRNLKISFLEKLRQMSPSPSVFLVYLGINRELQATLERCASLWYLPHYNLEDAYSNTFIKNIKRINESVISTFPTTFSSFHDQSLAPFGSESIRLGFNVTSSIDDWRNFDRLELADWLIKKIQNIIPNLSSSIVIKEIATPLTLYNYSLNTQGAMYGWASTLSQANSSLLPSQTSLDNLFITGHWTTQWTGQGGVSSVAYLGYTLAHSILQKEINYNKSARTENKKIYVI
jgi:prolycopene isomerase